MDRLTTLDSKRFWSLLKNLKWKNASTHKYMNMDMNGTGKSYMLRAQVMIIGSLFVTIKFFSSSRNVIILA